MDVIFGLIDLRETRVTARLMADMARAVTASGDGRVTPTMAQVWISPPDGNCSVATDAPQGHAAAGLGQITLSGPPERPGHRRLRSIRDAIWMVANVRLDGRRDLLTDLAVGDARPPADATDADLLLCAYSQWEAACLARIRGDFAFAVWDSDRRVLLAARDQLGTTPLYYAALDGLLAFSNDLQAVRCHPAVSDDLDERSVADFLASGEILDPERTIYRDIRRLPPAHALSVARATVQVRRYWAAEPADRRSSAGDARDWAVRFGELLRDAVADRITGNRVAVALSGGLDSASIAAITADALGEHGHIHAYNFVSDAIGSHEHQYAQAVCDRWGIILDTVDASALQRRPLDHARWTAQPSEFWFPNAWTLMFEQASRREGLAVVLTGLGADQLLVPPPARRPSAVARRLGHVCGSRLRALTRGAGPAAGGPRYPEWLAPSFRRRLGLGPRANAAASEHRLGIELIDDIRWANLFSFLNASDLGMPLDVRHPFADLRLIEFLRRIPARPWLVDKTLLRVAMQGRLPDPLLRRERLTSLGNPMPILASGGRTPAWMSELIEVPQLECFVDRKALSAAIETMASPEPLRAVALAFWLMRRHAEQG